MSLGAAYSYRVRGPMPSFSRQRANQRHHLQRRTASRALRRPTLPSGDPPRPR